MGAHEPAETGGIMRYVFDIDGVICNTTGMEYADATPFWDTIERIRHLKEDGHTVIFYTARGAVSGTDWGEVTRDQLEQWEIPYDELYFGKPAGDFYIDDKAINISDWTRP